MKEGKVDSIIHAESEAAIRAKSPFTISSIVNGDLDTLPEESSSDYIQKKSMSKRSVVTANNPLRKSASGPHISLQ